MKKTDLDLIDLRILSAVQKYGMLSKAKLAEHVNLTATPCWERLKKLEAAGFIRGQHADIALEEICDLSVVIVTVSLSQHRRLDFDRFEDRINSIDEITECFATGGGMDYVLKFVTSGLPAFQLLIESLLDEDLGIERYMTYIATRRIKECLPDIHSLASVKD